ncbi:MAG: hypothetical protein VX527_05465 [Planctomycetota bacterium]|nr:hypothetical protein [Planctomycetota bacterium]
MTYKKSIDVSVLLVLAIALAWVLTIIADLYLYWRVPKLEMWFNEFDVELPGITLAFLNISSWPSEYGTAPLYMPIGIAVIASISAILGFFLGLLRHRPIIIIAFVINVALITFLILMIASMELAFYKIPSSFIESVNP